MGANFCDGVCIARGRRPANARDRPFCVSPLVSAPAWSSTAMHDSGIDPAGTSDQVNHPVGTANAEFHRRRAEALLAGGAAGQREEIDAVFEMGRVLRSAGTRIPDDVLRTFLPQLCATPVAYPDSMSADEHEELDSIRRHLVDAIDGDKSKAMKRAVQTLFALAEVDLGKCEAGSERPPDHLSDLVVVTTFGAIGRVLVADHLLRAAETAVRRMRCTRRATFSPSAGMTSVEPHGTGIEKL